MRQFLSSTVVILLMMCSVSTHAFDYKNPQNQGVWRNEAGEKLHVNERGVREYLQMKGNGLKRF